MDNSDTTLIHPLFGFFRFYLFVFCREWKGRKTGIETSMCERNIRELPLGLQPRESNWQPFGSQASAQSTEPHQPGLIHPLRLNSSITYSVKLSLITIVLFTGLQRNSAYKVFIYIERDLFYGIGSCDYGSWQAQNLQGGQVGWGPMRGYYS